LSGRELSEQVARDGSSTKNSPIGAALCAAERWLIDRGLRIPFGIRELIVLSRGES
jgi:hypothetical protein